MGFLAPAFLGGLLAVGLPIYLHLLRQHKSTPLPFSSLMFFERRTQSSIKHRRLRYLLLFALRTALLILIAIAFARPFINSSTVASAQGGKNLALAFDDSFSMRQGDRLAQAKRAALSTIDAMRTEDRAQLFLLGGTTRILTEMTGDKPALRAAVESIEPSDSAASFAELSRMLRSMAQSQHGPVEAHLFSDMQKSSLPGSFADLQLASGIDLIPHAAASQAVPNYTVENVSAPRRVFDPKKVRVTVTVAGSNTPAANRRVSLLLNSKLVETKTIAVPANGRATIEFLTLEAPYGLNRGEARIDAADTFPADDHFNFSVERADPRPALFIHDARNTRDLLYFRTALEASNEPAFTLEPLAVEQSANVSPGKYAFVVISDVGTVPPKLEDALKGYVKNGGSVLVSLGKNSVRRVPVADFATNGTRYASPEGDRFESVTMVDATHPALNRTGNWQGIKFYQTVAVNAETYRVLARLSDGSPLLVEKALGGGRVLVFASTFDNVANDFPLQPAFVPFVEQTAHYLGGVEAAPPNYTVGSYVDLRTAGEPGGSVEVIGPDGQRALSLSEAARARNLALVREGFYDVRRTNGKHELAAVNPDRRESDLSLIPAETLALWKNTGNASAESSAPGQAASQHKIDFWWYVLLMGLIVAVAESVLGNRHLTLDKETA